jgi:hypothetical protein
MKKQVEHSVATSLCSAPPTESAGALSSLPPDILLCVRNAKGAFCATDCTGVNSFSALHRLADEPIFFPPVFFVLDELLCGICELLV